MTNFFTSLIEQLGQSIITFLPKLFFALVILVIGFKLQPIFERWLKNLLNSHNYDESLIKFSQSLIVLVYKLAVIFSAISVVGIQTTSIVAAVGAAGFAVGLALQGSMSNFASGILILTLKPIKIGEYIEISGYSGTVHRIEIFNTSLLTIDNKTIIIPNSDITSNVLINFSRQRIRRVDLEIGVSYESDIKKVKSILQSVVKNQGDLVIDNEDKKTFIRVSQLGELAIVFAVRAWCQSNNYLELKHNLLEEIKEALDKEKIEMPYKTYTIKK